MAPQHVRRLIPLLFIAVTLLGVGQLAAQPAPKSTPNEAARWRDANNEVGRFQRGHIDLLRAERGRVTADGSAKLGVYHEDPAAPELTDQAARQATLLLHPDLISGQAISSPEKIARDAQLLNLQQATHKLWIEAVSAKEQLNIQRRILEASSVSLELARRMEKVGNWGRNRLIDIEIAYESARNQLLQADQNAFNARQKLLTLIGSDQWRLPAGLPAPTPLAGLSELVTPSEQQQAELLARHPRYSLIERDAQYYERIVGPAMLEEWRQQLDTLVNATHSWTSSIPMLDRTKILWNHDLDRAIAARAEVIRMSLKTKTDLLQAREHVRATHAQATDILAKLQRLYTSAEEEALMRYNGMFISTWELIAKAQAKMQTELAVAQAKRAFWIALTDMRAFLAGAPYAGPGAGAVDGNNTGSAAKGH